MTPMEELDRAQVIASTRRWIELFVVEHRLCPFARPAFEEGRIAYVVSPAMEPAALLADLIIELDRLAQADPQELETSFLIHPWALLDFLEYNDFLDVVDGALIGQGLSGQLQVASFHPQYRFAGVASDAVENATNRSPYPMLHLLREESVGRAAEHYPDIEGIPTRNIELLRELGAEAIEAMMARCKEPIDHD